MTLLGPHVTLLGPHVTLLGPHVTLLGPHGHFQALICIHVLIFCEGLKVSKFTDQYEVLFAHV